MSRENRKRKVFVKPSLTQQSFKQSADINFLVKRFANANGDVDFLKAYNGLVDPRFGDFSNIPDYQSTLNMVREAGERFSTLPATIRHRFRNDPLELLSFVNDRNNLKEAQDLGLLPREAGIDPPPCEARRGGCLVEAGGSPGTGPSCYISAR